MRAPTNASAPLVPYPSTPTTILCTAVKLTGTVVRVMTWLRAEGWEPSGAADDNVTAAAAAAHHRIARGFAAPQGGARGGREASPIDTMTVNATTSVYDNLNGAVMTRAARLGGPCCSARPRHAWTSAAEISSYDAVAADRMRDGTEGAIKPHSMQMRKWRWWNARAPAVLMDDLPMDRGARQAVSSQVTTGWPVGSSLSGLVRQPIRGRHKGTSTMPAKADEWSSETLVGQVSDTRSCRPSPTRARRTTRSTTS